MVKILTLSENHAALLAEMHVRIFSYQKWTKDDFLQIFKNPVAHGLLLLSEENPIGYMLWHKVAEEAEIITIGILPDFQNKDFGQKLFTAFESHCCENKLTKIFLDVAENNKAAIAFYQKQGFVFKDRRKAYYKIDADTVDALLGVKKI